MMNKRNISRSERISAMIKYQPPLRYLHTQSLHNTMHTADGGKIECFSRLSVIQRVTIYSSPLRILRDKKIKPHTFFCFVFLFRDQIERN